MREYEQYLCEREKFFFYASYFCRNANRLQYYLLNVTHFVNFFCLKTELLLQEINKKQRTPKTPVAVISIGFKIAIQIQREDRQKQKRKKN